MPATVRFIDLRGAQRRALSARSTFSVLEVVVPNLEPTGARTFGLLYWPRALPCQGIHQFVSEKTLECLAFVPTKQSRPAEDKKKPPNARGEWSKHQLEVQFSSSLILAKQIKKRDGVLGNWLMRPVCGYAAIQWEAPLFQAGVMSLVHVERVVGAVAARPQAPVKAGCAD
jgi:hypothetical protein